MRHTLHQPQTHTKSGLAIFLARALRPPRMRVAKPTIILNITRKSSSSPDSIRKVNKMAVWQLPLSPSSVDLIEGAELSFKGANFSISPPPGARPAVGNTSGEIRPSGCRTFWRGKWEKTQADEGGNGGSNAVTERKKLTTR